MNTTRIVLRCLDATVEEKRLQDGKEVAREEGESEG
jgi:hypothetical protein